MSNIETFMTSEEISHLTQTEHKFVLKRACEALIKAGNYRFNTSLDS